MLQPIHRWLTDLEQTACGQRRTHGLRRPLVVRGWQAVTCKRCLGSIHWKLAQLQCQQPGSGVCVAMEQICAAAHICSYRRSIVMRCF
jgi:hypothetical protein